jgi:hypothetical protein
MENINDLFNLELINIAEAFPSVYTKNDVAQLLRDLQTKILAEAAHLKPTANLPVNDCNAFLENVRHGVENMFNRSNSDYIDYSSAEFCINYDNRIEIENVDLNYQDIIDEALDIVQLQFEETFGNLINNNGNTSNN